MDIVASCVNQALNEKKTTEFTFFVQQSRLFEILNLSYFNQFSIFIFKSMGKNCIFMGSQLF